MNQRLSEILQVQTERKRKQTQKKLAQAARELLDSLKQTEQIQRVINECIENLNTPRPTLESELLEGPVIVLDWLVLSQNLNISVELNRAPPSNLEVTMMESEDSVIVEAWEVMVDLKLDYDADAHRIGSLGDSRSVIMKAVADRQFPFAVKRISETFSLSDWETEISQSKMVLRKAREGMEVYTAKCWVVRVKQ